MKTPEIILTPKFKKIPLELRERKQWVCWKTELRDDKPTRVPYRTSGRLRARINVSSSWSIFEAATESYLNGNGCDGIGFVLSEEDPYVGIDLDNCVDSNTKDIKPWAKEIVDQIDTYWEISPSGTGLRGFAIGELPPNGRKKGDIEIYDKGRYLTVTGHSINGSSVNNCRQEIKRLHSETFQSEKAVHGTQADNSNELIDIKGCLEKAFNSRNGRRVRKLYEGDWSEYRSQSEADLALCAHFSYWLNGDQNAIDKAFRGSELFRPKWDERRGGDTYGQRTIDKAISSCSSSIALYDEIQELNSKHAVLMVGGKCVILNEIVDPVFDRPDINFSSFSDFRNFNANRKVPADDDKKKPLSTIWLESPYRRQYQGITFSPGESVPGHYNLYKGLAVEPKQGSWRLYKMHMVSNIAGQSWGIFHWIMAWMARIVQDPGGERPGTAIVLRGRQGTGKGIFTTIFGKLFGPHFLHITNQEHLTGRFNSHLKNCLVAFVDEGFWAGDKRGEGVLKGLVTEKHIICEPKFIDPVMVKNRVNLIVASNSGWIVPAGLEERRFLVLDVSDRHMQDTEYFKEIVNEMENGGLEALLYDLLRFDYKKYDLRTIPRTEALMDQIERSMTPVQKFWYRCLGDGEMRFKSEYNESASYYWPDEVSTQALYDCYLYFCKELKIRHPGEKNQFSKELTQICKGLKRGKMKFGGKRKYGFLMPPLNYCREEFEKMVEYEIEWRDD